MSAPVTANWNVTTINGVPYLVIDLAQFRIPLDWDPSSNMFLAVAAPNAAVQQAIGVGNFPALLQGADGDPPTLDPIIDFTPLAWNDTTPDSASWTEIATNTYQLSLALHQGQPGPDGTLTILSAEDFLGSATPGTLLVVNATGTGVTTAAPLCGDRYVPSTIRSVPSGNAAYTLTPITVPAQDFDWRPDIEGQGVVTPAGTDCVVDLIARLSNSNNDGGETTGNEVGRAIGVPGGAVANQVMTAGPPPGSGDAWDRVPAGQKATIFFRAERQAGSDYFTMAGAQCRFGVRVAPCPTTVGAVETSGGTPTAGPLTIAITTPGAFSQAVPSWANYVDVVALGDGGGGGAAYVAAGTAGAGTSVTTGEATLAAAGGSGGAQGATSAGGAAGVGAGSYALNGYTYSGGDSVAAEQAGSAPGGGGGGSDVLGVYGYGGAAGAFESATYPVSGVSEITTITGTVGAGGAAGGSGAGGAAKGAPGAVWLVFRQ